MTPPLPPPVLSISTSQLVVTILPEEAMEAFRGR